MYAAKHCARSQLQQHCAPVILGRWSWPLTASPSCRWPRSRRTTCASRRPPRSWRCLGWAAAGDASRAAATPRCDATTLACGDCDGTSGASWSSPGRRRSPCRQRRRQRPLAAACRAWCWSAVAWCAAVGRSGLQQTQSAVSRRALAPSIVNSCGYAHVLYVHALSVHVYTSTCTCRLCAVPKNRQININRPH